MSHSPIHKTVNANVTLSLPDVTQKKTDIASMRKMVFHYQWSSFWNNFSCCRAQTQDNEPCSKKKLKVASALLNHLEKDNLTKKELTNIYDITLKTHQLTSREFLAGKTARYLTPELMNFFRNNAPSENLHGIAQQEVSLTHLNTSNK